jgi:recombination protein RecA
MSSSAHTIAELMAAKHLKTADAFAQSSPSLGWNVGGLSGRLVELVGADACASLTAAFGLVLDAQRSGETAVWVTSLNSCFFPPDAAEGGVDLNALGVVRVPPEGLLRAADKLARSGAFGLIVIDLESRGGEVVKGAFQSRLLGLAREYDIAVLFLRGGARGGPLGSLVSLRGEACRIRVGADRHRVEVRVFKDKRRAPGWSHGEECRGPAGLC